MEILTKENFWDGMSQKYPKAMKHFGDWVDQYKKENDWHNLFHEGRGEWIDAKFITDGRGRNRKITAVQGPKTVAPKYHELPIAMQFGIFVKYTSELSKSGIIETNEFRFTMPGGALSSFRPAVTLAIAFTFDYLEMRSKL